MIEQFCERAIRNTYHESVNALFVHYVIAFTFQAGAVDLHD